MLPAESSCGDVPTVDEMLCTRNCVETRRVTMPLASKVFHINLPSNTTRSQEMASLSGKILLHLSYMQDGESRVTIKSALLLEKRRWIYGSNCFVG